MRGRPASTRSGLQRHATTPRLPYALLQVRFRGRTGARWGPWFGAAVWYPAFFETVWSVLQVATPRFSQSPRLSKLARSFQVLERQERAPSEASSGW
jgi:hypothetical protein